MSVSATDRFLAVAFSVLMLVSAAGVGVIGTAGVAQAQTDGDVQYRVNGGSTTIGTVDGGSDWTPPGSTSGVSVSGSPSNYSTGDSISLDGTVPSSTPSEVFQSELYGDQQWDFDATSGQRYEVRLYFAEIYQTSSNQRTFDVALEGETVLSDYDIYADVGHDVGAMKSYTVTPEDGTIDVDFTTQQDNAKISAIEIVAAEPEPETLGGPDEVDFGSVVTGDDQTEQVTVTNLGGDGDPDITIDDVSVSGDDAFSAEAASQTNLAPGESADIPVTFAPDEAQAKSATLEVAHSGSNSPLTVELAGEGSSDVPVGFSKSKLQGFSASSPTAIDIGPDGRAYVSTQGGTVYALGVERTGEDSYEVVNEVQIDAIEDIPNHNDFGDIESGEDNRQITGLTVGGTADQPVVYVSSSDPEIDVGQDDDDTDTNSGAISRLTINPGDDGTLQASEVEHDVMVLGLPRSEENHATNGLDLTPDGDTLYVAQGGHTNKGAPGDNFGHTPEYALSAAVLEIDLAQIENEHEPTSLQDENGEYPDLDYLYSIPTIQGGDLPFGGNDGANQAKLIEDGPVQVYSPGYRNPYDLVLAESGQLYVSDHGPNGGWGGQPADADGDIVADAASVTNHPNEDGSESTNDQLIAADEGDYAGHAAPIRANPTQADIYDENGNVEFDITESNSPVPESMVNPVEADYIPPTSQSPDPGAPAGSANTMETASGEKVLFGPTGGTTEYTASNFGGAMEGDILQVELGGDVERVELSSDGQTAENVETVFNTGGPLGITAQDDDEAFAGTVWTANHGDNDVTVFEPNDFGDGGDGEQCTGADDSSLDEDGDGYDNADEIDAGTDPCSSSSTPADFDDDGESNLNDPDDDNDGLDDTEDPFAVDPDNGVDTTVPVEYDLSELSLFGENGQGWTGVMTNGQDDYQDLYDPTQMTVGGAAEVLTVEEVPQGDAHAGTNTQQYGFQFGVDAPDEPFVVETTVASFPENPEDYQSAGLQIGTGDQSNYVKLVAAADGGNGGVQFAKEVDDSFADQGTTSDSAVAGGTTTLRMTVDPTTDPEPDNGVDEVAVTAEYEVDGTTTEVGTVAMPASWLDTSDGVAPAVGVISTSNGASPFSATWTDISVDYVDEPENQPPTADAGSDQTVEEGDSVTLDASGSDDPDGDQLGYTWTQTAGPDAGLSQSDGETTTFTAPEVDSESTLAFQVSVSDGQASDTDEVNVTVQPTDDGQPTDGEVVYRVNAGGSETAATDGGPSWSADTDSSPSPYVNADGDNGLNTYSTGDTITLNDSVPAGTPASLFQTERYDADTDGSTADDTEMQWSFDAQQGETYEVRLYFAEIFLDSSNVDAQGPRTFDVVVEGDTKLDDYDVYQQYGHDVGAMESFEVTPSDDSIDVEFLHEQENPKISAIEIVAVGDDTGGEMTVEEAVASADDDGDDTKIEFTEIQQAINWWQTDAEVPNTGGQTIGFQKIQELINLWQTDATIGDGNAQPTASFTVSPDSPEAGQQVSFDASGSSDDGSIASYEWEFGDGETATGEQVTHAFDAAGDYDVTLTVTDDDGATASATETVTVSEATAQAGAASVSVTPDSGTEASTYGGGSFAIENTGDQQISSVTFDLSSGAMPDMVWDPDGTAGDQAAKGLNIDSESGDGVGVVSTADDDVFSQPHNGVNGSDGYDVLTVEFTDFEPGESVSFSADNDPTSIKDATISSQEAGPVSGLELARSTVSAEYADGSVQETQLFGDGSAGGAQATLDESVAPAPSIGVQDVSLDDGALRDHHSAATVSEADQTVTVTGEPDETVTLLHFEGELELDNVPEYDGTPGYDIEAYEANKIESVDYQTVTLDSNGEAEVPVTLLNTTDVGGYNYFVATHGEPGSDTGLDSNVVVLKYEDSADGGGDDGAATSFAANAGGDAYTAADGTVFQTDTAFSGGNTYSVSQSIDNTEDDTLYQTERYGDFSYDIALEDGEYEVTLHFAEIFQGVSESDTVDSAGPSDGTQENDRVFNVSIEDQQVLSEYDIYAEVGPLNATQETFTAEVTDGELNVEFSTVYDNAKVSAIEVEPVEEGENQPPTADAGDDQTVEEGDSVTLDASGSSDADDDSLGYAWTQTAGPDVTLDDTSSATPTFTAPEVDANETLTFEVEVSDGESTATDEVNVTVEDAEPDNQAPAIEAIDDRTVTEGDTATVNVSASDADGDDLTLSVDAPDFVSLTDDGDGTGTLDVAPQSGDAGAYTVNVTADDGNGGTATESFQLTVESPSTGDELVYAVNAGGSNYTAVDGTNYVNDTEFGGSFSGSEGSSDTSQAIENTEDGPLYQTERYGDPLSYSMPVEDGTYEVTLQFAEIYHGEGLGGAGDDGGGDGEVGDRVFNVSVEGEQVLTDYDIYADVGALNATEKTFTVEVTDGELNVELDASADYGKLSAFTVSETDSSGGGDDENAPPTIDAIADQTVTEGNSTTVSVAADDPDGDDVSLSVSGPDFVTLSNGELTIAPESGDADTYTVDVTADDGNGGTATASFQLTVEEASSGGTGSADISVNADAGIDASTYSGGSFEITNTGDQQISSVQFDVSESLLPDAVFDPDGTAGDTTAKELSIDSESGDGVGVVSTADGDVFSQPHNGVDGEDGYDVMTVEFTDFEPGESVSFSIDLDPTTIKGVSTTGGAGSISGLELAGSQVNVDYADGSAQSSDLFGDGSAGGAQASATDSVPTAPTLGVDGVSLQSTDFPAHEAATVGESSQNLTLSGPAGASVELIHVEASEPPSDGYDLDEFEADNAQSVSYQTVTLDANGEATASVTLSESNLNYFIAAVDDGSGDTGQTSGTVILDYDSSAGELQTLHRVNAGEDETVSAIDDGPDWTGAVNASSQYLASVAPGSSSPGNSCGGEITSTTANVPSSTPDGVWNCERYGEMTWEFPVDSGQQVEVRLYVGNSFSGTSEPGQRQFNVSVEGQQVLTQYDPVADVGHETGTMKNFTATEDGDGTITVEFEQGAVENPEVRAIEIVETEDSSSE